MSTIRFDFPGAGAAILSGRLEVPASTPRGWAIFAHCLTCGKESHAAVRISRALAAAGIGVLRFDFAGVGQSEAREGGLGIASSVADLSAAIAAMTDAGMAPALLVGHSFGAAAVLAAAADAPTVEAVVAIAAPLGADRILRAIGAGNAAPDDTGGVQSVRISGRDFLLSATFADELDACPPLSSAAKLGRPLLLLHSPADAVAGFEDALAFYAAAAQPKSLVALDGADHLLTRQQDGDFAANIISAWAQRYLPILRADLVRPEQALGVVAAETGHGLYQLAMQSGAHRFLADEPLEVGGLDTGLSPYDFVSAGLAACTTMTMRLYAQRKNFPLERARTAVEHSKQPGDPARDLFTRTIWLEGGLDAEQRAKLLAIANRCPVDLTLVRGSDVETMLAER